MSKKGAVKTGGHGASVKARNQARAADMKKHGIIRRVCRDPISNHIVGCDSTAQCRYSAGVQG